MQHHQCPCGTSRAFAECCGRYLSGAMQPLTALQLMRSRYTAFSMANAAYLEETLLPAKRKQFDKAETAAWAAMVTWLGLEITGTDKGGPHDQTGMVAFKASFEHNGAVQMIEEQSQFKKRDGRWFYVKAIAHQTRTAAR